MPGLCDKSPMNESRSLAIVIPAYKPDFLCAALDSIACQELGVFKIYVGDDDSPADIRGICDGYRDRLDIAYVRFSSNLGGKSLVSQWNRCVRLTNEPWVWLFSDDDIMEPGCVARLIKAIHEEGDSYDLFHFGVTMIDGAGDVIEIKRDFPEILQAHHFASARLRFALSSFAPDFAFSRKAFDRIGGFIDFPLAWCSDDATWIAMAGRKGIRSLDGPRVRWRLSGQNISSNTGASVSQKMQALTLFLLWLDDYLRGPQCALDSQLVGDVMTHSPSWFYQQVRTINGTFWQNGGWRMAWRLRHLPNHGFLRDVVRMALADLRHFAKRPNSQPT